MLDIGDCASGNVRIALQLRRGWRNAKWSYTSRDRVHGADGNIRHNGSIRNDGGNLRDLGIVDEFRNGDYGGIVGNVRLGLKHRYLIVESDFNVIRDDKHSSGNTAGFHRDRQPRRKFRGGGTHDERIAGTDDAHCLYDDRQRAVNNS